MTDSHFVHLRTHSEYSITQGMVRIPELCDRAVEYGMPSLALSDLDNLFGVVKFYSAARKRGLKPIIGCDISVRTSDSKGPTRLLLLVQNTEGYLKLSRWLTRAYVGEEREMRAAIHSDWIKAEGSHGLIALSGWKDGDIERSLIHDDEEEATKKIKYWSNLFEGRFYLEIQRSNKAGNSILEASILRLAEQERIPVVATHPVEFLAPTEFMAHEARYCIAEGLLLADQNRPRLFNEEQYFKSQTQMQELFSDLPGAIDNTIEIAKRCSLEFDLGNPQLPNFPTPPGMSLEQFLAQESAAGLDKRMTQLVRIDSDSITESEVYRERLKFEIDTIVDMGFAGYFLIVADFINWAKDNDVPVGPGRGS